MAVRLRAVRRAVSRSGQMTVEFVVMFSAALAIALIAVNATLFFSECAVFDRAFRNAVCTYAASPAAGQSVGESCVLVSAAVEEACDADNLSVFVEASGTAGSIVEFRGSLRFAPTLFGAGSLSGAFGVSFPELSHEEAISVCVYKPGVIV